ncbi:hypothetical protein DOM22_06105 [Bdellovibrio sp. ZAP7]|uniref:hypothetical protein n=1 Tax=Bdellovibrio sp. ZAP7 TaxID=2231053 RepID=UPI0011575DF5|nr:hypothetical protein [Bdellovibrio sp. ZAP7]QDK44767.1 hypothetical protein DOM22_06105 [Bdellovibrio sp. ZAP7]
MKNLLGLICLVSLLTACENPGTPPPENNGQNTPGVSSQVQMQATILSQLHKSWSSQMGKIQWQQPDPKSLTITQAYVLGSVILQLENQPKSESIQLLLEDFPKISDPRSDSYEMLNLAKEFLKKENL